MNQQPTPFDGLIFNRELRGIPNFSKDHPPSFRNTSNDAGSEWVSVLSLCFSFLFPTFLGRSGK